MIAVVDYGVGNLFSLRCSLEYIGADCIVTDREELLCAAEGIILPGVGAFENAAERLRRSGLDQVLIRLAQQGKPLLGICLGMQLLFERSREYGLHQGLGLLEGEIVSLADDVANPLCRVPQIGWNTLEVENPDCVLLRDTKPGDAVYYVHSYYLPKGPDTAAWSGYGAARVSGVVQKGNVLGTQFHPEKSGAVGLTMLRSFQRSLSDL